VTQRMSKTHRHNRPTTPCFESHSSVTAFFVTEFRLAPKPRCMSSTPSRVLFLVLGWVAGCGLDADVGSLQRGSDGGLRVSSVDAGTSGNPRNGDVPPVPSEMSPSDAAVVFESNALGVAEPVASLWTDVSVGDSHACGIVPDGGVRCWGSATFGELGTGLDKSSSRPVSAKVTKPVVQLALGNSFTCAVHPDGTASCWGANTSNQLGAGPATNRSIPQPLLGLEDKFIRRLSASSNRACAIVDAGQLYCWGSPSGVGQFGATPMLMETPEAVTDVALGPQGGCVLGASRRVWCWGSQVAAPDAGMGGMVEISGLSDAVQVAAGGWSACARTGAGEVWCWGRGGGGQLGTGEVPIAVSPVKTGIQNAVSLSAAYNKVCAVVADGSVDCFGYFNSSREELTQRSTVPVKVPRVGGLAQSVSVGPGFACIRLQTGVAQCFGGNTSGQLGNGIREYLVPVGPQTLRADLIAVGKRHACALIRQEVWCWGENESNQVALSSYIYDNPPVLTPYRTAFPKGRVVDVETGGNKTCILLVDGLVWCAGSFTVAGNFPVTQVPLLSPGQVDLKVGGHHACVVTSTGSVRCWGKGSQYQLGQGLRTDSDIPVDVLGLPGPAKRVAAGEAHSCALLESGVVYCWGGGRPQPQQVSKPGEVIVEINACEGQTEILTADGRHRVDGLPSSDQSRDLRASPAASTRRPYWNICTSVAGEVSCATGGRPGTSGFGQGHQYPVTFECVKTVAGRVMCSNNVGVGYPASRAPVDVW
jgi:alpha-tubulin suppressor-like RCC1 family protein